MKNIKHIFFDLDHTIWDFEKNSTEALSEIFTELNLHHEIESLPNFITAYQKINAEYWHKYNHGKVTKEQVRFGRFTDVLNHFKVKDVHNKAALLGNLYIERSPYKKNIFPNTHETLKYLKKKYRLHIITNGFKEVQSIKLTTSKLDHYFDLVLCAEEVGVNKPNPLVFETALLKTGAHPDESLMIGDNPEADILGAKNCGFSTILFNPTKIKTSSKATQISDLKELTELL